MNNITICDNPLDKSKWEVFPTKQNACAFLADKFATFPADARIYHSSVDGEHDVTPRNIEGIWKLENLTGDFWVITYPHEPITIGIIIAIVVGAVAIGLSLLLRPKPATTAQASPNNSLIDRQNQARLNQRIPDIVGTVRSILDLIATPYKEYINSQQVEVCYMCVGKGAYDIHDIKDNTTNYSNSNISAISGTSIEVYGPNTSPNSGDAPQLRIGTAINRQVLAASPLNLVNGQLLIAPNANNIKGNNNIRFMFPDSINTNNSNVDFTQYFQANGTIGISGSAATQNGIAFNLDGSYTILSVTSDTIVLANPAVINHDWNKIAGCNANADIGTTDFKSATLATSGPQWVGPFVLNVGSTREVWCNFISPNGAYYLDGDGNQHRVDVGIQIGITPLGLNGLPSGAELLFTGAVPGSAIVRNSRAVTIKCVMPTVGPVSVRARRTSAMQIDKNDQVSDSTQWQDLYSMSYVAQTHFGNVTTVQTLSYATQAALSEKERKLNMLVTRRFPQWNGTAFGAPVGTNRAEDILVAMALDPFVGNRPQSEVDIAGIYATCAAIRTYFGTTLATEFCYTYDDTNRSFEEIVTDIVTAIGCVAYRRGSILTIDFEQKSSDATILFNHRNKLPNTETRTITFGLQNNNDGILFDYINPNASNYPNIETAQTLYFPRDGTAVNPKKITSVGIRNTTQALLIAWRYYQKMIYQNTIVQFQATREAALCALNERVLVADNTRQDTQDGEVIGQDGLILTLSQPPKFTGGGYIIWLQLASGILESHTVTPGVSPRQVVLGSAPSQPLSFDSRNAAKTTYQIVPATGNPATAMLINENTPQEGLTQSVKVYNYDDRYYAHDTDVITHAITPDAGVYDVRANYLGGQDGSTGGPSVNPLVPIL